MLNTLSSTKTLLIATLAITLSACTGTRPLTMGEVRQSLDPCPDSPNCVSNLADPSDETHYIAPIAIPTGVTAEQTIAQIAEQIEANESAVLVVKSPNYLYAEYTSNLMKYVDDVEFLWQPDNQHIDVRSASRLGRSDFGVNRERVEAIRLGLTQ